MNLGRVGLLAIGVAIFSCASIASAWTGPTGSPPNSNVSAPINIGSTFQEKSGSVWFDGGVGVNSGSAFCIGTSCITSWSQAGSTTALTGPYIPAYSAWSSSGTGSGGAAIYNDNGTSKTLMIVGNTAAGGNREVKVWDDLTVNNALVVDNGANVTGTLTATNLRANGGAIYGSNNGAWWSGCFGSDCTGGAATQYGVYANGSVYAGEFGGNVLASGVIYANGAAAISQNLCNEAFECSQYLVRNIALSLAAANNITAAGYWGTSDLRKKTDITPLSSEAAMKFITQVQPVQFQWKDQPSGQQEGYIAQQVIAAGYGNLVSVSSSSDPLVASSSQSSFNGVTIDSPAGAMFSINYSDAIPYLHEGLLTLVASTTMMESEIATLQGQMQQLQSQNAQIRAYLCAKDVSAPFCSQ